jgi:hypothetical protein
MRNCFSIELANATRKRRMTKHMILTSGRSGSNYLSNLLSNHPNVINYGEVLGDWTTGYKANKLPGLGMGDAGKYLDFIYQGAPYFELSQGYARAKAMVGRGPKPEAKKWKDIESFGVKDFSMNLIDRGIPNYLDEHPDIKVISLYRENALRRYASVVLLDSTGLVSTAHAASMGGKKGKQKVHLDPETFASGLARTEKVVNDQLEMVNRLPDSQVLSIRYEDLFASNDSKQHYATEVCDFLNVKRIPVESKHKKLNSDDLRELISNYDEVFEICRGTPAEQYFYY